MTKKCMAILIGAMMVFGVANLAAAKTLNLKLQSHLPPGDTHRSLDRFVNTVKEMSKGEIVIKLFPGSSIVPMKELLETVGSGAIEIGYVAEGYWNKLIPVSEVAGLPFAFRNLWEAYDFMYNQGLAEVLNKEYAKFNVYHLPYESYPVGLMTKKPINTVEDFKGMKIRAYGVMAEWLTELGTSTTYIPGGELYTALATGVVDGAHWGDAGPMYVMKFHEVLKNYMLPEPIQGAWNNLMINMDVWKKMTPKQQEIIKAAAMGEGYRATTNTRILAEDSLNKMVADWKVKVNTLSPAEVDKMTEAAEKVWEKVAKKDPLNAEMINKMKAFLKKLGYIK
ncbi:MAG TPA: TRAP transporter substrate-binding protein DctP [Desulfobacteria bacterium]|nr:TRAP transporter substrate-binding protein DctP [Desulfobacteria bacterium]